MINERTFTAGDVTIHIAFTDKAAGNLSHRRSDDAAQNEKVVLERIHAPERMSRMNAKAGAELRDVDTGGHEWWDGDALLTKQPLHCLTLLTADCIPLVLWDGAGTVLVLAHLGRQGAGLGLAKKAVQATGVPPKQLHAWMGPGIKMPSYAFDQAGYQERFDDTWRDFTEEIGGKFHVNLTGYVLNELEEVGVPFEHITVEPIDTRADHNYFSHYRAKSGNEPEGRHSTYVWFS
jgi:copper oxidase (laccase) domain-containing protein